jgi:Mg2+ and Co2+ transporter CorA
MSLNEASTTKEYKKEKISNWSSGRMLRRLASLRSACQGIHTFNGPKRLALMRMLRQAQEQGLAVAVVLPVSPAYAQEFLNPEVKREFEEVLADLQRSVPQAHWIRLDQLNELNSNEYFWDLVHINSYGQRIATEFFIKQLKKIISIT